MAETVQGLQEIYSTLIPAQIRRQFDHTLETHATCPDCAITVLDGARFFHLYPKKFLVIGVEPNEFGGVWAVIAVEGEPQTAFQLWLYDLDDDEYQLRSIEALPNALDEKLIHRLSTPAYSRYWL